MNEPFSMAIKFRLRGGRFMLVHLVPDMINAFVGGTFKALNEAQRMDAALASAGSLSKESVSLTSAEVSAIDEASAVIRATASYIKKSVVMSLELTNHTKVQLAMNETMALMLAGMLAGEGTKFFNGGSMSAPIGSQLQ